MAVVIPSKAEIHRRPNIKDPRFRGDDDGWYPTFTMAFYVGGGAIATVDIRALGVSHRSGLAHRDSLLALQGRGGHGAMVTSGPVSVN